MWDDILYVSLLLSCVFFGSVYRKIQAPSTKQWVGTFAGFVVAILASGTHVLHFLFVTAVNAVLITRFSAKKCHLISFFFSFGYLLFFFRLSEWFGFSAPSGPTNLIQMILTLKLAGLAFEINLATTAPSDDMQGVKSASLAKIRILDVFHYAFSYMGILTGPYYRYRTYWDSLHRPFSNKVDHWEVTHKKLLQVLGFSLCFLLFDNVFPAKYALTEEFGRRSFLYRFFYIYPMWVTFRTRLYAGMALAECACHMAGVGAYPRSTEPNPGLGPRNYKAIIALSNDKKALEKEDMSFETVHNMKIWDLEKCIWVRDAMKLWNTCVQYWMATNVYKRFPHKGIRTFVVMFLSAAWHGWMPGYFLCICQVPFYLLMEDIYFKLYKLTSDYSIARQIFNGFFFFMRQSCMAYLGVNFQLIYFSESWIYFKGIYFAGHLLVAALYVAGLAIRPYLSDKSKTKTM